MFINVSCSSLNVYSLKRSIIWEPGLTNYFFCCCFSEFGCDVRLYNDQGIMSLVRWSLETRCPVWTTRGGALAAGGGTAGGRGLALGREEFDREHRHFESGHTPLSCERPYSPWLAGWHPRAEAQRERVLVCEAEGEGNVER